MPDRPITVMKFGGTSVADAEGLKRAAQGIVRAKGEGNSVVAVLSAGGATTDELVTMAQEISPEPHPREMDMLLSTGERISCALCAMAIHDLGSDVISLSGSQAGIVTDTSHTKARILDVRADRIRAALVEENIVLVAGFQGVSTARDLTTLGRGGSDTTAVALFFLNETATTEIYTDVEGVYTTDPRICDRARKLDRISYEEMLELASLGSKVLQIRSVEFAMKYKVPLWVKSSFSDDPGTLVCEEDESMEDVLVSGIALTRDESRFVIRGVPDKPGVAAKVFGTLAEEGVVVDMIVQTPAKDDGRTDMAFTVGRLDVEKTNDLVRKIGKQIGAGKVDHEEGIAKVSIVGVGMRNHAGVAAKMFQVLADEGVNIRVISTSEIKISCLIDEKYAELAVRALHTAFGLDKTETAKS